MISVVDELLHFMTDMCFNWTHINYYGSQALLWDSSTLCCIQCVQPKPAPLAPKREKHHVQKIVDTLLWGLPISRHSTPRKQDLRTTYYQEKLQVSSFVPSATEAYTLACTLARWIWNPSYASMASSFRSRSAAFLMRRCVGSSRSDLCSS